MLDGDTISVLRVGQAVHVRLSGVDAPEKGQRFGTKARQLTGDLVFQRNVTVVVVLLREPSLWAWYRGRCKAAQGVCTSLHCSTMLGRGLTLALRALP